MPPRETKNTSSATQSQNNKQSVHLQEYETQRRLYKNKLNAKKSEYIEEKQNKTGKAEKNQFIALKPMKTRDINRYNKCGYMGNSFKNPSQSSQQT